jgi:hypothetical protein
LGFRSATDGSSAQGIIRFHSGFEGQTGLISFA